MSLTKRTFVISGAFILGWAANNFVRNKMTELNEQAANTQLGEQAVDGKAYAAATKGFKSLAAQYAWLENTRKNVGLFDTEQGYSGSGVLIDNQGTIAMATHEWRSASSPKLIFYIGAGADVVATTPDDFKYSKKHDLMFATIDPTFISKRGLRPARFDNMGYGKGEIGKEVIAVGFPDPSMRLHATKGELVAFEEIIIVNGGIEKFCKVKTNNVSFPGMSGGAIFGDGLLAGIINAGTGPRLYPNTWFTPSSFIVESYIGLYPDRANKAGIYAPYQPNDQTPTPETCQFNRRDFLSVMAPKPK